MDKYNLGTVVGMTVTELFSGSEGNMSGSGVGTITLNDDVSNYNFLVFDLIVGFNDTIRYFSKIISCPHFLEFLDSNNNNKKASFGFIWGYPPSTDFFNLLYTSTLKTIDFNCLNSKCVRILGIN